MASKMIIEKVLNGIRYRLSNENLKPGDKVYPIAHGWQTDDGLWLLHNLDFRENMSGFPDEPHTIQSIEVNTKHPALTEVHTDYGHSTINSYFKIIKKEEHIESVKHNWVTWDWVEIPL